MSFAHYTTLSFDAMCYHAARRNYNSAAECIPRIRQAENDFNELLQRETALLEKHGNDLDATYDEHEQLAIIMENREYEIGSAYGPFLQHLATVHILCVTSLEAHINIRAKETLEGRFFEDFERKSLKNKWLFLPRHLGVPGFDPGAEPFRSLSRLVKCRNSIVHYKGRKEEWNREGGVPTFLKVLGFTIEATEDSLNCVKSMIAALANQLHQEPPHWLYMEDGGYFESEFELDIHRR